MNLPSIPARLTIPQSLVDGLLGDPVKGAEIILGVTLDPFMRIRLRNYWFFPEVIDSSGFSSAKTFVFWCFVNLRAVLIPNQWAGIFYQRFATGQETFWKYYNEPRPEIFRAQLGRFSETGEKSDNKANAHGASCYTQYFKNGSEVRMPAPDWGKEAEGQASFRYNIIGIDEWTKVDAKSGGINKQILGRRSRPSIHPRHPVWRNHVVFLATAEAPEHPAYQRYRGMKKRLLAGDPMVGEINFCYKDFSNVIGPDGLSFRDGIGAEARNTALLLKTNLTPAHYRREVLGLWSSEGRGWYSGEALEQCQALGAEQGLRAQVTRREYGAEGDQERVLYFHAGDPAPALGEFSDDAAYATLRAEPRVAVPTSNLNDWKAAFVWAHKLRAKTAEQQAGFIHQKNDDFNFAGEILDAGAGGGGGLVMGALRNHQQLIRGMHVWRTPICRANEVAVADGKFTLCFFKRADPMVETLWPSATMRGDDNLWHNAHVCFQEALDHTHFALPPKIDPDAPRPAGWTQEHQVAHETLMEGIEQLRSIAVAVKEDGTWLTTRNGALTFDSAGKKDVAYAMMLAWVRFLIWLRRLDSGMGVSEEDDAMCSTM